MARILLTAISFFITLSAFAHEAQNEVLQLDEENNYILIISSYPYEETWSTTIAKSIRAKLEKETPEAIIHIAYAGIGNRNSFLSERFALQKTFTFSKEKTDILIPSVLVLIGEESWMVYRIMDHKGVWDKIPVVLCGVSSHIMEDYSTYFEHKTITDSALISIEDSKRALPVTAIMKKDNELETIHIMTDLFPSLEKIVFISSDNFQDKYTLLKLEKTIKAHSPQIELDVWHGNKKNANEIKKRINTLPQNTAILTNSYILPSDISNHIPVFTCFDRQPKGENIIGGVYPLLDDYATETANTVLKIQNQTSIKDLPFKYIENSINLNKEALNHFNIKERKINPYVVYTNIPPSFLTRHYRTITPIILACIVLVFFIKLGTHIQSYRKQITTSLDRYKELYEEYMTVYENMPMGMLIFDKCGKLLSSNPNSDTFFKLYAEQNDSFHLFKNTLISKELKEKIQKGKSINKIIKFKGYYLRFIIKSILNEQNEQEFFMIILDNTDIQQAKEEKESMYDVFNFAMNASSIGVAEYNRVTNKGIATDAWFNTFFSEKATDFSHVHQHVIEEDIQKVLEFFNQIGSGNKHTFSDVLRVVKNNEVHWVRVLIQLIKYAPQNGEVIFTELAVNIDKQKDREKEFAIALKKAQKSDRLKNAFVANMSLEIRSHIEEVAKLSAQIPQTPLFQERVELLSQMHEHNSALLQYITETINSSKKESSC